MSKSISSTAKIQERTIRLVRAPSPCLPGKFVICENGKVDTYTFSRMESQIGGMAWRVNKIEFSYDPLPGGALGMSIAASYDVLLNGSKSTCDCPWGTYGAHKKPCRHVAGLLKLIADGLIG